MTPFHRKNWGQSDSHLFLEREKYAIVDCPSFFRTELISEQLLLQRFNLTKRLVLGGRADAIARQMREIPLNIGSEEFGWCPPPAFDTAETKEIDNQL